MIALDYISAISTKKAIIEQCMFVIPMTGPGQKLHSVSLLATQGIFLWRLSTDFQRGVFAVHQSVRRFAVFPQVSLKWEALLVIDSDKSNALRFRTLA